MPSAREQQKVVDDYLAEECCKGRVMGPLRLELFPQVHPQQVWRDPKRDLGKMAAYRGHVLPCGCFSERWYWCSLTYVEIKDAVRGILERRRCTQLAKVDIRSAYRNIPVHPDDRWLSGMIWRESLFVDAALPFGLRSAPKIFTAVADAAEWIVRREGVDFIIHYLDDFLLMGPPGSEECSSALEKLLGVFRRLGLPVAPDKLEGPTTRLVFLGFELDTMAMEVRLPAPKLQELKELIQQRLGK